jgi:5-hydroxyisourate hydrolase
MGFVTTHVLDTANGTPAKNMKLELWEHSENGVVYLSGARTNSDGRLDAPIIGKDDMKAGQFELRFHVADYYREKGCTLPEPAFLDIVPIVFGIADTDSHYHVPLLVSPYGYSTYRGS